MPKFFVSSADIYPDTIHISGEDVNHIKNVLRLKTGENIIACDGNGTDYSAEIERFESDTIVARITGRVKSVTEPPIDVTLYQGLPKSDKMDFIIQKSIELGVKRVIPVLNERTVVRIENKKDADKKVSRWQKIALEAAKQCNRGIIPEVGHPLSYHEALKQAERSDLRIIPYERESVTSLKSVILKGNPGKISLFIGPEGGFSEKEIQEAVAAGVNPVTLGPRILRTETAGIAVLSILMYELGDVNK